MGVGRGRCPLANVGSIQAKSSATPNNKDFVPNIRVHDATPIGTEIESPKVNKLLLSRDSVQILQFEHPATRKSPNESAVEQTAKQVRSGKLLFVLT